MNNIIEITQLVLKERQGRDRGWWEQMEACFHSDSLVNLSWFHGTGPEFVAQSRERVGKSGVRPVHRTSSPVVHLHEKRGIVELPVAAEVRSDIDGTEADLVSFMRLVYRVEQRENIWKIKSLDCIYERDTLTPAIPGTSLNIDLNVLRQFRMPYRCLAYQFSLRGTSVGEDLYGDDQPNRVNALYDAGFAWMRREDAV